MDQTTPNPPVESPPPAPRPPEQTPDPRQRLRDLAATLAYHPDPRRLTEYLTLRRHLR